MPPRSNSLQDVFGYYKSKITTIYSENEAKSILYLLMEHLFGWTRLDISLHPEQRLSESEIVRLHDAVVLLRKNIPIQHIIGFTEFCGCRLNVNGSTLIPRPETEELVQLVSQHIVPFSTKILDIGTGSGAIAIVLKKRFPANSVFACDISPNALQTAKQNAEQQQTNICFFQYDILSSNYPLPEKKFDVIVSNPPYIPLSEKQNMSANVVQYEPSIALFVLDGQPLLFYDSIAQFSLKHLSENGKLFFEIHENFGEKVVALLVSYGFKNVTLQKDVFEKDRMIWAEKG
ncbi:MAG: peptide chain release factor N(5)-glutamine methyltransferase [Bacteroidales bacterium]|nr:peptide chain release factor N(5)-glutamine methyltransferase [Bacteroidales bacterium]